jgi:zona occludens toxin (predicted ATPase)
MSTNTGAKRNTVEGSGVNLIRKVTFVYISFIETIILIIFVVFIIQAGTCKDAQ